jgi:hypothetical protein
VAKARLPFRFMGRDPVSGKVKPQARPHLVEERGGDALCGAPWILNNGPAGGWITKAELRSARFPPSLCHHCQDVLWGIRRGKDPADAEKP